MTPESQICPICNLPRFEPLGQHVHVSLSRDVVVTEWLSQLLAPRVLTPGQTVRLDITVIDRPEESD